MNILIPCHNAVEYMIDCVESLINNSRLDNVIIVLADKVKIDKARIPSCVKYVEVDYGNYYRTIEFGIRNFEAKDGYVVFTNDDMLYAKDWDMNLMRTANKLNADTISTGLITPLRACGWEEEDIHDYANTGAICYDWIKRDRLDFNKNLFFRKADELRVEFANKYIPVRHLVPLVIKKYLILDIIGKNSYYDIGDVNLERELCRRNIRKVTVLDSIVYHYVGVSQSKLKRGSL